MSAKPRIEFSFSRSTVMKMTAAFLLLAAALASPAQAASAWRWSSATRSMPMRRG